MEMKELISIEFDLIKLVRAIENQIDSKLANFIELLLTPILWMLDLYDFIKKEIKKI